MYADWWGDPCPEVAREELLMRGNIPFDAVTTQPPKDVRSCPNLLKTVDHFVFFSSFLLCLESSLYASMAL